MASILDAMRGLPAAVVHGTKPIGPCCPLCGSPGYAGLVSFECGSAPCRNYKAPKSDAIPPLASAKKLYVVTVNFCWDAGPVLTEQVRARGTGWAVGAVLHELTGTLADTTGGHRVAGVAIRAGWYATEREAEQAFHGGFFGEGAARDP